MRGLFTIYSKFIFLLFEQSLERVILEMITKNVKSMLLILGVPAVKGNQLILYALRCSLGAF